REQAVVKESRTELLEDMKALEGVSGISFAGLIGSAYERDVTLDAITNSLTTSIIIAVILCFLILLIAFRSLRYSIVTVIPVILVAAWLYAFMYLAGFHLNAVTATIAAISIGVGIDYSVHITARFRQELKKAPDGRTALENSARQTGSALFGSAASTILGFLVIGLAPMPMFSSFGILTALMIFMAFVAALLVLPSMLMLIAPKTKRWGRDFV
ncbi:MAG: efflux RND transporter permease subunit, partial [Candidatus Hadarchaeaceae archaeon]